MAAQVSRQKRIHCQRVAVPPGHGSVHFRVTSETEKNGDLHLEEKFLARMQLTVKVIVFPGKTLVIET